MSIRAAAVLALASILAARGAARAQPGAVAPQPVAEGAQPGAVDGQPEPLSREQIARDVVRGIRRAIALGPTFGGFSTIATSGGDLGGGISFGLELELFQGTIPTPEEVQEIFKQKAMQKLAQVIRDRFAGQTPDEATRQQLLRELAEEIKAEVLATLRARPRILERPGLSILLEANYLLGPADWLGRLGVAVGFGRVSLGPSFSVRFGDETVARLGAELSIHLLPTPSPSSPVFDVFVRGDFELHKRATHDDQIVVGVRALLDLI
jgi:hypothetical protein